MGRCIRATRNALRVPAETWSNGAVVYAESIRYANGTVPGTKMLQTLVLHEIFGDLVHQSIALPPRRHWRIVDLTVEELFAQADDPAALQRMINPGLSIEDRRSPLTVGAMLRPTLVLALGILGSLGGGWIGGG